MSDIDGEIARLREENANLRHYCAGMDGQKTENKRLVKERDAARKAVDELKSLCLQVAVSIEQWSTNERFGLHMTMEHLPKLRVAVANDS